VPACCAATTSRAAADPTGFAAQALPRDRGPGPDQSGGTDGTRAAAAWADAWLLSPLDPGRGFVPCGYCCIAAQEARREALSGCDAGALRPLLAGRVLQLAPGVALQVLGSPGRSAGSLCVDAIYGLYAARSPGPLIRLVEALVVRRLLAGSMIRFFEEGIDVKQGLVFVKMLHRSTARWIDLV
jgi:hypothetical protein